MGTWSQAARTEAIRGMGGASRWRGRKEIIGEMGLPWDLPRPPPKRAYAREAASPRGAVLRSQTSWMNHDQRRAVSREPGEMGRVEGEDVGDPMHVAEGCQPSIVHLFPSHSCGP
jgi:hypothetical protein